MDGEERQEAQPSPRDRGRPHKAELLDPDTFDASFNSKVQKILSLGLEHIEKSIKEGDLSAAAASTVVGILHDKRTKAKPKPRADSLSLAKVDRKGAIERVLGTAARNHRSAAPPDASSLKQSISAPSPAQPEQPTSDCVSPKQQ